MSKQLKQPYQLTKPPSEEDILSTPRDLNPQPWIYLGKKQDLQKALLKKGISWHKIQGLTGSELQNLLDEFEEV